MTETTFTYTMSVFTTDGRPLVQFPLETDWQPAIESARLTTVRRGILPASGMYSPCAVNPVWHPDAGEPHVCGFRVSVLGNGSGVITKDFSIIYWQQTAQSVGAVLVQKGLLQAGDKFLYEICAHPSGMGSAPEISDVSVEEIAPDVEFIESSLANMIAASSPTGRIVDGDMPVFIPREILRQVEQMKDESEAAEVGSILVGQFHTDPSVPEVFLVLTAQIPATLAQSQLSSLTFTPDAWSAVRAALELRQGNEVMCGWFHSHPTRHFCKCEICTEANCRLSTDFFSSDDVLLHRTVFPKAYSVALVVSDKRLSPHNWENSTALFGWRQGVVASRGFHILEALPAPNE